MKRPLNRLRTYTSLQLNPVQASLYSMYSSAYATTASEVLCSLHAVNILTLRDRSRLEKVSKIFTKNLLTVKSIYRIDFLLVVHSAPLETVATVEISLRSEDDLNYCCQVIRSDCLSLAKFRRTVLHIWLAYVQETSSSR
jgi:hypothetical protein